MYYTTRILTHWGRVTHICVSKLTITGSDNGLSPKRHQAIIWTNAGILSIGPLGTANFSEISIGIKRFSFKKMHFKMSSAKWRPFCLGLNELIRFPSVFKQLEMSQIAANGDDEIILEISRSSFTDLTDLLAKFYYVLIGNWSYHYPSNCWIQDATE